MMILVIRRNARDMFDYMNELRELLARTEMCHDKIQQYYSRDELIVGDVKIRFMTGSCGINTFIGLKPDYYHINGLTFGSILSAELIERGAKRLYTISDIANTISKHLTEKEKKPMTNFEFYKDKLKDIGIGYNGLAVTKKGPAKCADTMCGSCQFHNASGSRCNSSAISDWLYSEHVELPTITAAERKFLELLKPDYYIARNEDGILNVFVDRPMKDLNHSKWEAAWSQPYNIHPGYLDGVNFNFIKWEDKEPWQVKDLL